MSGASPPARLVERKNMQKRKLNKSEIDLKIAKANIKRQILLKASNQRQNRQLVK